MDEIPRTKGVRQNFRVITHENFRVLSRSGINVLMQNWPKKPLDRIEMGQ